MSVRDSQWRGSRPWNSPDIVRSDRPPPIAGHARHAWLPFVGQGRGQRRNLNLVFSAGADPGAGLPPVVARDRSCARLASDAPVPAKPSLYIWMLMRVGLPAPIPDCHSMVANAIPRTVNVGVNHGKPTFTSQIRSRREFNFACNFGTSMPEPKILWIHSMLTDLQSHRELLQMLSDFDTIAVAGLLPRRIPCWLARTWTAF